MERRFALIKHQHPSTDVLYPQSAGEAAAGVTPTYQDQHYGWATRYTTNATPGTTDMQSALQNAIDSADLTYPVVRFTNQNAISKPLLVRSTSVENLVLEGSARTVSEIKPSAVDIKQSPQNINCLIFNQCDNGHLHLKNMRFSTAVAHTGYIMYAVEGGGADASGQAAYSMVVDDVWFSMSAQNTGYMYGGFSNLKVSNTVYESSKTGCWVLNGAGNGDQLYVNTQMFICYDAFIVASDSNVKAQITVLGLNCYSHLRGRLLEFNNGVALKFDAITLEPDAANLGDVGLFKFTDCANVIATNFSMATRTGVPAGAVGIEIINGFTGKFAHGTINATTGMKFSGTGVLDVVVEDVDFTGCTDCLDFSGTALSGKLKFIGCKFNDAQQRCIIHRTGTLTATIDFVDCEILNAGLGGNSAFRNIDYSGTGKWTFYGGRLGQNNASAVAARYVTFAGTQNNLRFIDTEIVGTPPTALYDGTAVPLFQFRKGYGGVLASAATVTLPFEGDIFHISGTTNITTLTATGFRGARVTLIFQGALTFTDGSNLTLAGNFVTTADDSITLTCDGTNWYEVSRSVN